MVTVKTWLKMAQRYGKAHSRKRSPGFQDTVEAGRGGGGGGGGGAVDVLL